MASVAAALVAVGPMSGSSPAVGEATPTALPKPPADGVMGFVVSEFVSPIIPGKDACPQGPALKLRDAYVAGLAPAERERLLRKENEKELERLWKLSAFGPNDTNVCSQPDMFDKPLLRTVQSPMAWGLDLDGDGGKNSGGKGAASADSCAQQDFTSPTGEKGVDNQEYRAQGCKLEWRGLDGMPSDQAVGMKQFHVSGEWTQVLLLRGVDSLQNDDDVEVIYANTPDRPFVDGKGQFLRGATFTISEAPPRHRNVLRGKIVNGVLTTEPKDIALTQTWGQGGARDIRGNRGTWDFRKGRLKLTFQPDGSLRGLVGGYRPVFDLIISPSLGSAGSPLVAGIDCAAELTTIRKLADGLRNPKTGQCEGISSAMQVSAVPAFVNDAPSRQRTAAR
jgi:hypothetical protein